MTSATDAAAQNAQTLKHPQYCVEALRATLAALEASDPLAEGLVEPDALIGLFLVAMYGAGREMHLRLLRAHQRMFQGAVAHNAATLVMIPLVQCEARSYEDTVQ